MTLKIKSGSPEARFIERLGQIAQESGMTRIAGQIWAAIVIADGPVGAADLIEALQISKGSLSTNVRILEMLEIVVRRSVPGERQCYYAIADLPYFAMVEKKAKRFEKSEAAVAEARKTIKGKRAQKQLADLEQLFTLFRTATTDTLRTLETQKK